MKFGVWSNGFRPHSSAARSYAEDLRELVVADEIGLCEAWISEHHGEALYVDKVDVLPASELLMCKAAAMTKQIRFGAAVRVIHLTHPVDTAAQAAVADNVIGDGRYMFGFGSGFPAPQMSNSRGLTYEDRPGRTAEALELILKCWSTTEPFDWDGRYWQGRDITVIPKPLQRPHMPMATATATPATIELAAKRGYGLLIASGDDEARTVGDAYSAAAEPGAEGNPRQHLRVARFVYIADSTTEAVEQLRPAVEFEMEFQRTRGLLRFIAGSFGIQSDTATFDDLVAAGAYVVGDPETVYARLERTYEDSRGFGVLLLGAGKSWATFERREESLRRFAAEVAPRLAMLPEPMAEPA